MCLALPLSMSVNVDNSDEKLFHSHKLVVDKFSNIS